MVLKWGVLMGLGLIIRISPQPALDLRPGPGPRGSSPSCCSRSPPRTRCCRGRPSPADPGGGALHGADTALADPERQGDPALVRLSQPGGPTGARATGTGGAPCHHRRIRPLPGQIVGRLLHGHGIGTTILEQDASQIEMLRKYGYQVFYRRCQPARLCCTPPAPTRPGCWCSPSTIRPPLAVIEMVKKHFPHLRILARAQDRPHAHGSCATGSTACTGKPWGRRWISESRPHAAGIPGQPGLAGRPDVQAV